MKLWEKERRALASTEYWITGWLCSHAVTEYLVVCVHSTLSTWLTVFTVHWVTGYLCSQYTEYLVVCVHSTLNILLSVFTVHWVPGCLCSQYIEYLFVCVHRALSTWFVFTCTTENRLSVCTVHWVPGRLCSQYIEYLVICVHSTLSTWLLYCPYAVWYSWALRMMSWTSSGDTSFCCPPWRLFLCWPSTLSTSTPQQSLCPSRSDSSSVLIWT